VNSHESGHGFEGLNSGLLEWKPHRFSLPLPLTPPNFVKGPAFNDSTFQGPSSSKRVQGVPLHLLPSK